MNGASLSLSELLSAVPHSGVFGPSEIRVTGCTCDSREVVPGDLFVALKGFHQDGRAFVEEAVKRGARAVLARGEPLTPLPGATWISTSNDREAFSAAAAAIYRTREPEVSLVGVTGTNGKTTVAYLLRSIFNKAGGGGMMGTIEYDDGEGLKPAQRTTPEANYIHRWLHSLSEQSIPYGVMEVSSHSLVLARVKDVSFRVAAFTNLTRDHLDFHRTMEAYYCAKKKLFDQLLPNGVAVINTAFSYGARLASELEPKKILRVGLDGSADLYPERTEMDLKGIRTVLKSPGGAFKVRSRLVGVFNLHNILVAAGAALSAGAAPEQVAAGIDALHRVPGRMERVDAGQPFTVLVDYAHTDDALKSLLTTVRALHPSRIITVFGCGGDRDKSKRPLMGTVTVRLSDISILTSDNPRTERPETIAEDVEAGIRPEIVPGKQFFRILDRRKAIGTALKLAEEGDVVVVAGKGHEREQTIGSKKLPFHDPTVVAELLARMGWRG